MAYTPSPKILSKYADVLINFALGGGKGIKRGDAVYVIVPESAKLLFMELQKAILKAGGHMIPRYLPDDTDRHSIDRNFYLYASDEQLTFFPKKFMRGLIDQIDHSLYVISETNPRSLKGIHPEKIMKRGLAFKPFMDWRNEKENKGKFSWTIALYGTPAMAKEAGLTEKEYWDQIIKACFLNEPNPIGKWKSTYQQMNDYINKLNKLKIEKVHVEGPDVNLWVRIGERRRWQGGRSANIPSFEIFTSPDWRGTNGWIRFNQPLYHYGNIAKGISLRFKNGRVIEAKARVNQKLVQHMIATKNADKVGEFSLTDRRFSRITKFMAETLYDENIGGPYGNTHIAVGTSYQSCYDGNISKMKKADWQRLGFNNSSVHTDMISTAPRKVTAYLSNSKQKVIYNHGQFVI